MFGQFPHPALRGWISRYWSFTGVPNAVPDPSFRVLPDLATDIVFDLTSADTCFKNGERSAVIGVMTKARTPQFPREISTVGISLKPYSAAVLLRTHASGLKDQVASTAALGLRHFAIVDELAALPDRATRYSRLDKLFIDLLPGLDPPNRHVVRAVEIIVEAKGRISVEALAHGVNLSRRHLTRAMSEHTGLTTKEYLRVVRLQSCLLAIGEEKLRPRWGEIALAAGFSDQAHFITDFHRLVGLTPQDFWSQASVSPGFKCSVGDCMPSGVV